MTKQKRDNSVLFFILAVLAGLVGAVMAIMAGDDSTLFLVGCLLVIVGIVLFILAMVQYTRNVKAVAGVVMGAAVKVNNLRAAPSASDEVAKLAVLHANGSLSDDEFADAKAKLLSHG